MDCPRCGYAMSPFDVTCPRCRRLEQEGKAAKPQPPPPEESPPPATPILSAPMLRPREFIPILVACSVGAVVFTALIAWLIARPSVELASSDAPSDGLPSQQKLSYSIQQLDALIQSSGDASSTELQRQQQWEGVQGKYVTWWGEVVDVEAEPPGYTVYLKCNPTTFTFDVVAEFDGEWAESMYRLRKGQAVQVSGRLDDHHLFGYLLGDCRIAEGGR